MFNIITYLKGRVEYLKKVSAIWPDDTDKAKCAQARLHEVQELLFLLQETPNKKEGNDV